MSQYCVQSHRTIQSLEKHVLLTVLALGYNVARHIHILESSLSLRQKSKTGEVGSGSVTTVAY
jgi:hypothetical protein